MWRKLSLLLFNALLFSGLVACGTQGQVLLEASNDLIKAVLAQDRARVQAALEQGVDPNLRDEHGAPVLSLAVCRPDTEIVRLLVSKGADIHAKAKGSKRGEEDLPVIWTAAGEGTGETVRLLLEAGADPNARGAAGFTPLMVAAMFGNTATLQVLIAAKVDLEVRSDANETALMAAAEGGQYEATRLLLDAGAEINALGELKATPLMYAAQYGFTDVVALLIENGADPKMRAAPGFTALDFAKRNGHEITVSLLENGGRQAPPDGLFENLRRLLYPTPIELDFEVMAENEDLKEVRQKILKGNLKQARDLLEAERSRAEEISQYWLTLFYVQQKLGDRKAALESLRHILARPDLPSRDALQAWRTMRDFGEKPPPEVSKQVLGVVSEVGLGPLVFVVAAFADGQPRLFVSSGPGLIGEDWQEEEVRLTKDVVRLTQDLVEGMAPGGDEAPLLPKPGRVRFTLLTPGGSYSAEDSHTFIVKGQGLYAQLYAATNKLHNALQRRYQEEIQKDQE